MFRVGDKVKIVKWSEPTMVGEICEVSETHQPGSVFVCRVRALNIEFWNCLVYASEIEKLPTKGEQLLLDFML